MVKTVGKYQIGKTLGEGTFGKVKFAMNTETGESVAIKVLDKERIQKQSMGAQIKREISIMKLVHHKSIVKLNEVLASRTKIFIVIELVTGGELFDRIVAAGRLDEGQARHYFRQLVDGVEYCHSKGVCHRDLKPENLLLDENGDLKISDFGLSALYEGEDDGGSSRSQLLHTTCGTPNYVAPEVLADKGYDGRTADVWSCGVILYVLLAGFLPFDEPTMTALFRKIQNADFAYPSWFGPGVKALLGKILTADPARRITLKQVKEDPWFVEGGYVSTGGAAEDSSGGAEDTSGAGDDIGVAVEEEDRPVAPVAAKAIGGNHSAPGLKRLNAFDLINQCGGIALNRMLLTQSERQVVKVRQFTSSLPPLEVLQGIDAALQAMGCDTRLQADQFKVKGALLSSSGMIGVIIQSYSISDSVHLVEIRRGKGDILEYYKLFNDLVQNKISHLIHISPNGGQ
jgi:polyhydroxyalkanoate synthesis regulator phasin